MLLASAFACALRAQKAEVSSFDLSLLDEGTTPADLFFIREHFPAPRVSAAGWVLSVNGAVSNPLQISFDDLVGLPPKELQVTMECAENPVGGGLVSHAQWAGISLASLLEKARPAAEGRFVRFSGADGYSRTIPLTKAMHPDTLLAHRMNDEKLPANHGFPLRAMVPGWYGMDSVKWLRSVEVLADTAPEAGYVRQVRSLLAGTRPAGPVTSMNVKSVFSRPLDGAILVGRRFIVRGAAWAGETRVRQVDFSSDAGKTWQAAKLLSTPQPYSWVHWSYDWTIRRAGSHQLAVRATDDKGREQPADRPPERIDEYEWNAWQTLKVLVT
jgi:DMSO/TMAO reductase YedYZ molybdopterin-dependent catalytic subunit